MNDIIISVRDLCKCFGDFVAVDHITFDVKRGEIFGFLGANGAGKTTAIDRKSTRLNSSHYQQSRMPSSA